jgi:hypothetical protein
MPPKSQRSLSKSLDHYAEHRCPCGHIVYADDGVGASCRFCSCLAHECAARPWPPPSHDTDSRFEEHGVSGYEL